MFVSLQLVQMDVLTLCFSIYLATLQFFFDDLVSPNGQPTQAFRRVVCVPFQRADARARAALERKVPNFLMPNFMMPNFL